MGYGIFSLVCFRAFRILQRQPAASPRDRLAAMACHRRTFLVASATNSTRKHSYPTVTALSAMSCLTRPAQSTLGLLLFLATVIIGLFRHAPAPTPTPAHSAAKKTGSTRPQRGLRLYSSQHEALSLALLLLLPLAAYSQSFTSPYQR